MLSHGRYCLIGKWSESWRLEREARHLLTLPLRLRREELEHHQRSKRRTMLEAEIMRLWKVKK